jgi:adenylosuccinate synthase
VIAAGSEIEIAVLEQETNELEAAGIPIRERLLIDSQATILTDEHKAAEGGNDGPLQKRIGSTGKGIGACRADRIMRSAGIWDNKLDTSRWLNDWLKDDGDVLIEGTQGYGLGLHAGYYPTCTSSDCRAIDFLAMAGISPWSSWVDDFEVWVVLRTYPIRVAGNSGPLKNELTWDELARRTSGYIQPEKTTVTKKVRRIGEWDPELAANAVMANGGFGFVRLALTFADYVDPTMFGANSADKVTPKVAEFMEMVEGQTGAPIQLIGTGPSTVVDFG